MRNSYNKFRYASDESYGSPPPVWSVSVGSLGSSLAKKR
ncbi:hypothetical protein HDG35_006526 [Paraburkholderia sp. JPY681]|nr:hypothetical protein [Paraburkholderia atlantica]